jgi:hypothetical protein
MPQEQYDIDNDDLARIWRCAQHRRAEEIYSWLTRFLSKRRQLKSSGGRSQRTVPAHLEIAGHPISSSGAFHTGEFP